MANRGLTGPDLGLILDGGSTLGLADGALLRRASGSGPIAEAAFAALVSRHGPMVARVCRGLLGDRHAADDAAQAVFVVLLRKARSVRDPDRLAPWLHGVALRTARAARAQAARRRRLLGPPDHPDPEATMIDPNQPSPEAAALARERAEILHAAVARLPHRYRDAVILCDLQGLTHAEAAAHLGCPVGTVSARLTRARSQLRTRLARHRLDLDAALAPALAGGSTAARTILAAPASSAARSLAGRVVWAGAAARWQATVAAALVAALAAGGASAGPGDGPQVTAAPPAASANRPPESIPPADDAPRVPASSPAPADDPPRAKTTVGHPTVREVVDFVQFEGRLAASRILEIRSPSDGFLIDLPVAEGDAVARGQVLFQVGNDRSLHSQIEQIAEKIAQVREQLARTRSLARTPDDPAVIRLKEDLDSLQRSRQRFEKDSHSFLIRAPFAGVLGNLTGVIGQEVGPRGNNLPTPGLATLITDDPMRLDFQVGERDYLKIRRWLGAQIGGDYRATIGVGVGDEEGFPHPGRALFRTAQFDEKGFCTLHAELPNADHALVSGQSARVRLEYGGPHPAVLIPDAALIRWGNLKLVEVLVVDDRDVLRVREVKTGDRLVDGLYEVKGGIDARTRIVLDGAKLEFKDRPLAELLAAPK